MLDMDHSDYDLIKCREEFSIGVLLMLKHTKSFASDLEN
jgi:hypothetical protein